MVFYFNNLVTNTRLANIHYLNFGYKSKYVEISIKFFKCMGIRSVFFSISVWLLHIIAPWTVRVTNHFSFPGTILWASLVERKNPWLRICLQCQRPQVDSWVRKVPWRRDRQPTPVFLGFPGSSDSKEHNVGDLGWKSGLGRSPGGGHGKPLQCSCLENILIFSTESHTSLNSKSPSFWW